MIYMVCVCSLSSVTHLGGQPALDVQGEGGGDVGVVACVVHKYNLIKKRLLSFSHVYFVRKVGAGIVAHSLDLLLRGVEKWHTNLQT